MRSRFETLASNGLEVYQGLVLRGPGAAGLMETLRSELTPSVSERWLVEGPLLPKVAREVVNWAVTGAGRTRVIVIDSRVIPFNPSGLASIVKLMRLRLSKVYVIFLIDETCEIPEELISLCQIVYVNEDHSTVRRDVNENARVKVISVLKAVARKDRDLLEKTASNFDQAALELLITWTVEAITGRWEVFGEEESYGLSEDPNVPRRMLLALSPEVRPRVLVKVAFEELLR